MSVLWYDDLAPARGPARGTVVMVHGGAHSGACYLRTASGAPGWAPQFAERGYRVIVPDWPGTGRSGYLPPETIRGETVVAALGELIAALPEPVILLTHSMSGCYGWRLLELHRERIAAVVGVAPAPPGNIQPEPEIVAEDEDAFVVRSRELEVRVPKNAPRGPDRGFVERKLVGESRFFPREFLDRYAASLLAIPPRLLLERQNVRGAQLRVADPSRLSGAEVLVITGTEDIDHRRPVDEAIVTWLREHGAAAEFCWLGDRGIVGNGHMQMLEDNAAEIAGVILDWLER